MPRRSITKALELLKESRESTKPVLLPKTEAKPKASFPKKASIKKKSSHGMGSIRKKRDNCWELRITNNGKPEYYYEETEEAIKQLQTEIYETKKKEIRDPNGTIEAHSISWINHQLKEGNQDDRVKGAYASYFYKHIIPSLGDVQISALSYKHLKKLVTDTKDRIINKKYKKAKDKNPNFIIDSEEKARLGNRTCELVLIVLKKMLDETGNNRISKSDFKKAKELFSLKVLKKEIKYLTDEEQQKLMKAMEGSAYREIIVTTQLTGLRIGEALSLKWSNIDFKRDIMNVTSTALRTIKYDPNRGYRPAGKYGLRIDLPKNQASAESVGITDMAKQWLMHLKRKQEVQGYDIEEGLVHPKKGSTNNYTNENNYIRHKNILKHLQDSCKIAGIPEITPHGLRHSFATSYYLATKDIKGASKMLRHKSIEVTERMYTHFNDEALVKIAKAYTTHKDDLFSILNINNVQKEEA